MIINQRVFTGFFWFFSLLIALIAGGVIAIGERLFIGSVVSLAFYGFLIFFPVFSVNLILIVTLFFVGLLALLTSGGDKVTYAIAVLALGIALPHLCRSWFSRDLIDYKNPFLVYLVCFLSLLLVTQLVNYSHFFDFVAGYKRMLQLWPVLFLMGALCAKEYLFPLWRKIFFILALIQLPICLYQLMYLVPLRVWTPENPLTPIDVVAGTFGATMSGGGASGVMGLFIVTVVGYFLAAWRYKIIKPSSLWWLLPIAIPLFLGEIKIVAIYLPIMFWIVFKEDLLSKPFRFILAAIFVLVLMFLVVYLYLTFFARFDPAKELQAVIDYNFGDVGYGTYYLNRTTVITFWFKQQDWYSPLYAFFGHGLGSSYGAEYGTFSGYIAKLYPRYGLSLSSISILLWDVGLFGVVLFLSFAYGWLRVLNKIILQAQQEKYKSMAVALKVFLIFWLISLFYDNSFSVTPSFQALWCMAIILSGWILSRTQSND